MSHPISARLRVFLALALAVAATAASAGDAPKLDLEIPRGSAAPAAPPPPSPPARPATTPGNPDVSPLTKALVQDGVLACTSRINQVAKFLTAGAQSGATLFPIRGNADQSLVSASLELVFPEAGQLSYAGVSFAPSPAGGCAAVYEAVTFWPARCDNVAATRFGGLKRGNALRKNVAVLDGGSTKVFLMPAGDGCVSIKKEVVQ